MTNHQIYTPPPPFIDRGLPECQCPADCGGRPEAMLRLAPSYPVVRDDGRMKPPEHPHAPTARGELVFDTLNQRVGAFMDRQRDLVYLRPERGGPEWEVDAKWLVRHS
ncbi:hypothetical protein OG500_22145 [Kitasatospora sp. NBC_01250]|uniref:hypothetical protein n=1 Tax=Kitasatospora sp. NBC_01250 TaxID=2903571 RepID=UPI002E2FD2A1|nr:hypothetical protein [Kitasatospora sp. NBC_01250]